MPNRNDAAARKLDGNTHDTELPGGEITVKPSARRLTPIRQRVQQVLNQTQQEVLMTVTKSLLAAVAALTMVSAIATTAAEAKDGCGKGFFYNGQRCTPKGDRGFRAFEPGIRGDRWSNTDRRGDGWSSFDRRDRRDHRGDRFDRRDRGVTLGFGDLRVRLGDGKPKFDIDL
jgi:hypothetical protein